MAGARSSRARGSRRWRRGGVAVGAVGAMLLASSCHGPPATTDKSLTIHCTATYVLPPPDDEPTTSEFDTTVVTHVSTPAWSTAGGQVVKIGLDSMSIDPGLLSNVTGPYA